MNALLQECLICQRCHPLTNFLEGTDYKMSCHIADWEQAFPWQHIFRTWSASLTWCSCLTKLSFFFQKKFNCQLQPMCCSCNMLLITAARLTSVLTQTTPDTHTVTYLTIWHDWYPWYSLHLVSGWSGDRALYFNRYLKTENADSIPTLAWLKPAGIMVG